MHLRLYAVILLSPIAGLSQSIQAITFGGSGTETATAVAADADGSVYVAGTTTSFDLPVLKAFQPSNRGADLLVSRDSGRTWQPLPNLAPTPMPPGSGIPPQVPVLAVSPSDPNTVYAARGATAYKSTDGLQTLNAGVDLPIPSYGAITGFAVSPASPSTVYASVNVPLGVFKSTDTGMTWSQAANGLPTAEPGGPVDSLSIDPFHPDTLWAWAGSGAYVSTDGAASWTRSALPFSGGQISGGYRMVFDAATPGVIYGPSLVNQIGIQKSTDGGATWNPVAAPFPGEAIAADPVRAGYLYSVYLYAPDRNLAPTFYRSTDGGATWQSFPLPGSAAGPPASDPANPDNIIAGSYRSEDDGQTWTLIAPSRITTTVFAGPASSAVYAASASTSDAFVVKYAADGATPLWATYFGGMGAETATSINVDAAGNVWLYGTTSSTDLPVTAGALQKSLRGITNLFLAKFTRSGELRYCTYLGSQGTDGSTGLAVSPDDSIWITGTTNSLSFPVTSAPSNVSEPQNPVFVAHLDHSGSRLLYSTLLGGSGWEYSGGIAVDAFGRATVTGSTYSADFPVTAGAVRSVSLPGSYAPRVFVVKLRANGGVVFSTYLGGATLAPGQFNPALQNGNAVGTDAAGNIYIAGTTSMTDFPVTPGAYQGSFKSGCAYPALEAATGTIGTLYFYYSDNTFLMKLSPNGGSIIYSTLLGGSCYDRASSLAVASHGIAFIAGETDSQDFPQANSSAAPLSAPQYESFVSEIDTNRSTLNYSTYLFAGPNPAVALSRRGKLRIAGAQGFSAQTQPVSSLYSQAPAPHAALLTIDIP